MGINVQDVLSQDPEFLARQLAQKQMQQYNPQGTAAGALGTLLGRGIANIAQDRGFFSVSDPALQRVADIQRIYNESMQGFDANNPSQALESLSKNLASAGYGTQAALASQEAAKFRKSELEAKQTEAKIRKEELSQAQELQLRQELAALGPNATEDQVLSVVTKYGSPDKIMAALTSAQDRRAKREQDAMFKQMQLDIQRQGLQLKQDLQDTKLAEKTEKQQAAAQGAFDNAGRVIQTVTEAKSLVGPFTAGFGGYLAALPGTDARKLQNKVNTIKANLGFDRLQQMRDASPTGGALGQVAVQEINFLQSTVAALDTLEAPQDILAALNKIEQHYSNWKTALEGKLPANYQSGGGAAAVPTAPQVRPSAPTVPSPAVTIPAGVVVKRKGD